MSNRYYDSYIYAVDENGQTHLLSYAYHASLGDRYKREVMIADKYNSVFYHIDAEDEVIGTFLPAAELDDCRSYFSSQPTQAILQTIAEAGMQDTCIVQLIWLHFESTCACFLAAEGYINASDSERCIETRILEDAIAKFPSDEVEAAAQEVLKYIL